MTLGENLFITSSAAPTNWKWRRRYVGALWHSHPPTPALTPTPCRLGQHGKRSWKWKRCMASVRRTVTMRLPGPREARSSTAAAQSLTTLGSRAPTLLFPTPRQWGRWVETDRWRPSSGCPGTSARTTASSRRSLWANVSGSTGYVESWVRATSPRSSWASTRWRKVSDWVWMPDLGFWSLWSCISGNGYTFWKPLIYIIQTFVLNWCKIILYVNANLFYTRSKHRYML